jgi:hypothetical protein
LHALEEALRKGYSVSEAKNDPELRELQKLHQFRQLLEKFTKSGK